MPQVSLSPEVKAAIDLIKQSGGVVHFPRRHVEVWGQKFSSVKAITKDPRCEVSYPTLMQRLTAGIKPEDAVKKNSSWICQPITCWGETFSSVGALVIDPRCEVGYNVFVKKVKQGQTPEEAVKDQRVRKPITTIEQAIA